MSDVTTQNTEVQMIFYFDDSEESSRVISIPVAPNREDIGDFRQDLIDAKTALLNTAYGLNQFIQKTGWRDDDPNQTPQTTTNITFTVVQTRKTAIDLNESAVP